MYPSEQEASSPAGRVRVEPRGRGKRSFWKNIIRRIFANLKFRKVSFLPLAKVSLKSEAPLTVKPANDPSSSNAKETWFQWKFSGSSKIFVYTFFKRIYVSSWSCNFLYLEKLW